MNFRYINLRYTKTAIRELDAILSSLDVASPQGAKRVRRRLKETIDLLLTYPAAGRLTDKNNLRRIIVFPYPYVIFYRVDETYVTIHGIRHTSRKPTGSTTS